MATTIYSSWGSTTGANNFIRAYLTYTVTTTDTTVKIDWTAGVNIKDNYHTNAQITNTVSCTGQSNKTATVDNKNWGGGNHQMTSGSYTYNRTTSASTKTITTQIKAYGKSAVSKSFSFSVPALKSYNVMYNANGGDGSVATQTKWYGKSLTLASSGFSKENHTLLGWATDSEAAAQTYELGATYNGNAGLNLYAVWQLNYIKPTFEQISVYRTDSQDSDSETDDGTYIRIAFTSTQGSDGNQSYDSDCLIAIDGVQKFSGTIGTTFAQNYGGYDANAAHSVTVKIFDENDAQGTTRAFNIPSAIFPIDILRDGSAMGIMHVAVEGEEITLGNTNVDGTMTVREGLTVNDDVTVAGNVTATGIVHGSTPYVTSFKRSTNGIWLARQWSNGVLECWSKNDTISGPSSWSSFGSGLYRGDRVINFDFASFTELYSHNVTCAGSAGSGYTGILNAITTNSQLTVRLLRNSNSTSNYSVSLRITLIGKGTLNNSYGWTDIS